MPAGLLTSVRLALHRFCRYLRTALNGLDTLHVGANRWVTILVTLLRAASHPLTNKGLETVLVTLDQGAAFDFMAPAIVTLLFAIVV